MLLVAFWAPFAIRMSEREILIQHYESPCGTLLLGTLYDQLCLCDWADRSDRQSIDRRIQRGLHAHYADGRSLTHLFAEAQLTEYFSGKRSRFSVPLLQVGTPFQRLVWNQLLFQPYGTTLSYSRLASLVASDAATRAVSSAVGANALSIFIPCHRIVGKNHDLVNYAGGLEAKYYLLNMEIYLSVHSKFEADYSSSE